MDNDNNYLCENSGQHTRNPLVYLKNILQISAIIIAVIPECTFVGLPSDPEGDLHFFVCMEVMRKNLLSYSPRNVIERSRNRIIFLSWS